jgi:hypothetical protein
VIVSANRAGGGPLRAPRWLTPTLWLLLLVIGLALVVLAVLLVVKWHLLSSTGLSGDQTTEAWVLLGVALGAIAALIATLLIEQHSRRISALTHEAAVREQLGRESKVALDKAAEERLTIEVVARVLELITVEGHYAPKARVAGAMALLSERPSNGVAMRILRELWAADAVDTDTAVWLVDRALVEGVTRPEEAAGAAALLAQHATQLLPTARDGDQSWFSWPASLMDAWPQALPPAAKADLVLAAAKVFLAREPGYWKAARKYPLETLVRSVDDDEVASKAAIVLVTLLDRGALAKVDFPLGAATMARSRELSVSEPVEPWLHKGVRAWLETLWVPPYSEPA